MAKKMRVNKTKAVQEYLKKHPDASPMEISEALKLEGIEITVGHASNIKSKLKKLRLAKKTEQMSAAAASLSAPDGAPSSPAPAVGSGGAITLEQIKKVAQMVRAIGGFDRLKEMLEVVREVGGLRQFRELLEAMSVTDSDSSQP